MVNPGARRSVRMAVRTSCRSRSAWMTGALTTASRMAPDQSDSEPPQPVTARRRSAKIAVISSPYSARNDWG